MGKANSVIQDDPWGQTTKTARAGFMLGTFWTTMGLIGLLVFGGSRLELDRVAALPGGRCHLPCDCRRDAPPRAIPLLSIPPM